MSSISANYNKTESYNNICTLTQVVVVLPLLWPWSAEEDGVMSPGEPLQLGGPGDHWCDQVQPQQAAPGGEVLRPAQLCRQGGLGAGRVVEGRKKPWIMWNSPVFLIMYLPTFQCVPSKQCGSKGKQKRSIFCQSTLGKRVSKKRCRLEHGSKFKPKRKRRCEKTVCGFKSCADVRQVRCGTTQDSDWLSGFYLQSQRVYDDGEYSIVLGGRNVSVFCYNMNTSSPAEYLSLPTGESENYSEVRLLINIRWL